MGDMKANDMEGQLNLFGGEPYQPKHAEKREERTVELDVEAEEFLSVGRRRKKPEPEPAAAPKKPAPEPEPAAAPKKTESAPEPAVLPKKSPEKRTTGKRNIVMQRSFRDAAGNTATAAYVDYNMVYVEGVSGKATLTHYPESKAAVDRYLLQIEEFAKTAGLKKTDTHPALKNVSVREAMES